MKWQFCRQCGIQSHWGDIRHQHVKHINQHLAVSLQRPPVPAFYLDKKSLFSAIFWNALIWHYLKVIFKLWKITFNCSSLLTIILLWLLFLSKLLKTPWERKYPLIDVLPYLTTFCPSRSIILTHSKAAAVISSRKAEHYSLKSAVFVCVFNSLART